VRIVAPRMISLMKNGSWETEFTPMPTGGSLTWSLQKLTYIGDVPEQV
jgi:hypothetical protein